MNQSTPKIQIDIFTLFPAMFVGPFTESIVKRAVASGAIGINVHDIRDWTTDKHHTADDTPYGGGAGMVMKAPPIVEAVEAVLGDDLADTYIAFMAAGGKPYSQSMAQSFAQKSRIALVCGHYEGIDQRAIEILQADEISVGDFVLTGGELPAMVIADSVIRLVPGIIDAASIAEESHTGDGESLVEYPHYTRPLTYRDRAVPEVLVSGHHARIREWRSQQALSRTERLRPDLIKASSRTGDT